MGFDHCAFPVPMAKFEAEVKFLSAALAPLNIKEQMRPIEGVVGMGDQMPFLWVTALDPKHQPYVEVEGAAPFVCHIALSAKSIDEVDAFYKAAIEAGAKDNGKPGVRAQYHPGYYGAFVYSPAGHNVEAVVHLGAADLEKAGLNKTM